MERENHKLQRSGWRTIMTEEGIELSKKLLHAQGIGMKTLNLVMAQAFIISSLEQRLDKLEAVVEGMALAKR